MDTDQKKILDGTVAAAAIQKRCFLLHQHYQKKFGQSVSLGVLSIGDSAASKIYIGRKKTIAKALGFNFLEICFPQDTPRESVMVQLNRALKKVHGMIVQLPVVPESDARFYLSSIPWDKDVDGLNPMITGPMTPCTPLGCWFLLKHYGISVKGKNCVIVGRSYLVGRPLAKILLDHHATVTVTHSHTPDLPSVTNKADILFVAAGARHLITPKYVQPDTIVLDIGIHRTPNGLTGDVRPDVYPIVHTYSPVPGGVGPMTVIALMWNTLKAAFLTKGIILWDDDWGQNVLPHTELPTDSLNIP